MLAKSLQIDFWDGMTSVDGYAAVRFINAIFYKTTHLKVSWDDAYTYEYNRFFAMLSRRLSNWDRAADHIYESPFVWISAGGTSFEAARDPDYVADQLLAARRWGMGREFANYTYDTLTTFDYGPYVDGMRAATTPGIVDRRAPDIDVREHRRTGASGDHGFVSGTATDDFAVRVVRWSTDAGSRGSSRMRWEATSSPSNDSSWRMGWTAAAIPLHIGTNTITITVEDIHGLTSTVTTQIQG